MKTTLVFARDNYWFKEYVREQLKGQEYKVSGNRHFIAKDERYIQIVDHMQLQGMSHDCSVVFLPGWYRSIYTQPDRIEEECRMRFQKGNITWIDC